MRGRSASTTRPARARRPTLPGPRNPRTPQGGKGEKQRCLGSRPTAPIPSTIKSALARAILVLVFLAAVPRGGDGAPTSTGVRSPIEAVGGAAPSSLGGQVGVQDTYELMMALRKERRAARGDVRKALFHENAEPPVRSISLARPARPPLHAPPAGAAAARQSARGRSVSRGEERGGGGRSGSRHGAAAGNAVSVLSPLYPPGAAPAGRQ
ncbi:hypothetical protein T484DRAFT_1915371 [Baffinella frigidus]|nr:hypothetical protein T484DRAFT_1915371 [Cryptophyta sp. CCMP2293]